MLKLVKMVSVLAVLLAFLTVSTIGYLMVFGNTRINDRANLLAEESAIESFLKALGTRLPNKNQISPLVKQAGILALRINPPKPKVKPTPVAGNNKPVPVKKTVVKPVRKVSTKFSLLATCQYENFPEKSLALVDLTAKGHQWIREGDEVGHLTVHKITDGSVILYQNGKEHSIINLPDQPESKLLKKVTVTTPKVVEIKAIERIVKPLLPKTEVKPTRQKTVRQPQPHKLPVKPAPQPQPRKLPAKLTKSAKEMMSAIGNIIKETEALPDKDKQADDVKLWAEVLKKLEESNKEEEKIKARKAKESNNKKK
jgi:hypothetical protein